MQSLRWSVGCLLLSLMACKQAVDVTPPTADILAMSPRAETGIICGEPSERVFYLTGGDTLRLELLLRDDEALSQYKIEIHQNFDCHGHAGKVEDWSFLEIVDVEGTEARINRAIPVPENVSAGAYNYHYQIVDQAGNITPYTQYYDLLVTNLSDDEAPQLLIEQPSGTLTQVRGTELVIAGLVQDNLPLGDGGQGKLTLEYRNADHSRRYRADTWPFEPEAQAQHPFTLRYALPITWVPGEYEFYLTAYDAVNNPSSTQRFTVNVER
jgi:hypothetical protein